MNTSPQPSSLPPLEQTSKYRCFLPGFKASCLTICILYVFLAGGLFVRGIKTSMAEFKVPPQILNSPHYLDAIGWVYTHMIVIGLMVGVMGLYAEGQKFKQTMARLLLVAHVYYTYLDFRTSDSILGNGLYQGPGSVIPAFIGLFVTLLFLHLGFCPQSCGPNPPIKISSSDK